MRTYYTNVLLDTCMEVYITGTTSASELWRDMHRHLDMQLGHENNEESQI